MRAQGAREQGVCFGMCDPQRSKGMLAALREGEAPMGGAGGLCSKSQSRRDFPHGRTGLHGPLPQSLSLVLFQDLFNLIHQNGIHGAASPQKTLEKALSSACPRSAEREQADAFQASSTGSATGQHEHGPAPGAGGWRGRRAQVKGRGNRSTTSVADCSLFTNSVSY